MGTVAGSKWPRKPGATTPPVGASGLTGYLITDLPSQTWGNDWAVTPDGKHAIWNDYGTDDWYMRSMGVHIGFNEPWRVWSDTPGEESDYTTISLTGGSTSGSSTTYIHPIASMVWGQKFAERGYTFVRGDGTTFKEASVSRATANSFLTQPSDWTLFQNSGHVWPSYTCLAMTFDPTGTLWTAAGNNSRAFSTVKLSSPWDLNSERTPIGYVNNSRTPIGTYYQGPAAGASFQFYCQGLAWNHDGTVLMTIRSSSTGDGTTYGTVMYGINCSTFEGPYVVDSSSSLNSSYNINFNTQFGWATGNTTGTVNQMGGINGMTFGYNPYTNKNVITALTTSGKFMYVEWDA